MATVTPYNDLEGAKTTGGTWTKISGPGPAAPGSYNGTMNFTGTTDGESVYEYEVTASTCTHTTQLTYNSITPDPRTNETCATAQVIFGSFESHYNDERCPGLAAPTNSGVAAPTGWSGTEPDIWYRFYIPTTASNTDYEVVIDGSPYSDGIKQPMIAAYSGTCGGLIEEDSSTGSGNSATINFSVLGAATPELIYIRIASTVANAGQFDLIITQL